MAQSKLILMEGLPSTGKSTNAGILLSQLKRNGLSARWIHEMARPHPTLFFYEAYLKNELYHDIRKRYPNSASILNLIGKMRSEGVGIDLLELEWNHLDTIEKQAFLELKSYDVWNFSVDQYMRTAIEKWEHFVQQQMKTEEIVILDSSIFQFQIYTLILAGYTYQQLEDFVNTLLTIVSPLNPVLIYLYRENTEDTIYYLIRERGIEFLEKIWARDQERPYYRNLPKGADGYQQFLMDYGKYAKSLFDSALVPKLSLEISNGDWTRYNKRFFNFLELKYTETPIFPYPEGNYYNEELEQAICIDGEYCLTPGGGRKRLLPRAENDFALHDIPVILCFEKQDTIIRIAGEQLCERWTTTGTIFKRIRP